ncbi:hypothetical protein [Deinococcus maricopensis]|uniref:Uncharacterized protein n=1 Tax=Deinococcus maricopensis (strain DSM 21211 / LMG 22137 / NRRL B-23946 / LB-34) TaxID=709986 RepID=E8UAZ8_DEIML|nr:hypothetical protein [Deinococcus maricopensis]ADV68237.1 hypothetical protein Deima_2604 [Deinococcus maricopensis DSM 21211]
MYWLLVLALALVNIGGLFSVALTLTKGAAAGGALETLLKLALLDAVSFWLLRQLRDR